jgi:hypothetical protein
MFCGFDEWNSYVFELNRKQGEQCVAKYLRGNGRSI